MNVYIKYVKDKNITMMDEIELASLAIIEYMKDVYPDFDLMLDIHDMEVSTLNSVDDIIREAISD